MNYQFLSMTQLFLGMSAEETESALHCLQARTRVYQKGEAICQAGNIIEEMGLILSGSVNIKQFDAWGNVSIYGNAGRGEVFAEAYACVPDEILMVDVIAAEPAKILFLNTNRMLNICTATCPFHIRLVRNMLTVMASRNLNLSRKISHTTPKSIRGRLLSYLSDQAIRQGRYQFEIPFNRQQLADYLCVDRSAMSNELSKMQKDGLLTVRKNTFCLKEGNKIKQA
ncbi:MAG: Crp/Fnr family transcriptional regulator [Lachnospiraceae bacterium]